MCILTWMKAPARHYRPYERPETFPPPISCWIRLRRNTKWSGGSKDSIKAKPSRFYGLWQRSFGATSPRRT